MTDKSVKLVMNCRGLLEGLPKSEAFKETKLDDHMFSKLALSAERALWTSTFSTKKLMFGLTSRIRLCKAAAQRADAVR